MNPKLKRQLWQIIPVGIIWVLFSISYMLLEKGLLGDLDYYPSTQNPYKFNLGVLSVTVFIVFLTGLLFGLVEVRLLHRRLDQYSLVKRTTIKLFVYLLIYFLFTLSATTIVNSINLEKSLFDPLVLKAVSAIFNNMAFFTGISYLILISVVSLFYLEMNSYLGQEVLSNFFMGKYYKAKEEERIFMFLDMKSSTTHAEQLGHIKYFEMLSAYYADISDPVLEHLGNIYQYVGDEMVITWSLEDGLSNNNCIKTFFAMKKALESKAEIYIKKFGIHPSFKAGIHFGQVTVGEIGTIKKDLMFTGDVLNTTARIQSLCNEYEAELLISGGLKEKLNLDKSFESRYIDKVELRGKTQKIDIYTVKQLSI